MRERKKGDRNYPTQSTHVPLESDAYPILHKYSTSVAVQTLEMMVCVGDKEVNL